MKNFDQQELDKFSQLADEWWDPSGKFKPLHLINPLRVSYIEEKVTTDLNVLDIGCGGGILSELLHVRSKCYCNRFSRSSLRSSKN